MVYYTFSQGFRPGGFNQNGGSAHAFTPDGVPQYFIPELLHLRQADQQRDRLEDGILRPPPAVERRRVPGELGQRAGRLLRSRAWSATSSSTPTARTSVIKGVETSLSRGSPTGLTLQGAASWNSSEQTNSPVLINNNPASPTSASRSRNACNAFGSNCVAGHQPVRPDRLPERQCAADPVQPARALRVEHRTATRRSCRSARPTAAIPSRRPAPIRRSRQAGRHQHRPAAVRESRLHDLRCLRRRREGRLVRATLYGENLSNSNASMFVSTDQFIVAQTPLRPRVLGGTFGYKF